MQRRKTMTRNNLVNRTKLNMAGLGSGLGKSRVLKACISSRSSSTGLFNFSIMNTTEKMYNNLPVFSQYLKTVCSPDQLGILNFFESFPYIEKREQYIFDSNTSYSLIELNQSHFVNGTVRITKPGIYVLTEDIVFSPNENDDFFPRMNQLTQFPMGSSGPFHLGFFAAITIESDNVLLDLNGKSIVQSQLHNIEQRFYAHIELASSPFIPNQGPGNFGSTIITPKNVCIMNGTLGLSSHHGIHGNKMENIIVHNVIFKDFEVAASAMNGGNNCILNNLSVLNTNMDVKVLSTYSSARFIRKFLKNIENIDNQRHLNLSSGVKTITKIIQELESEMSKIKNAVKNNTPMPNNIFTNPLDGYDANVYGIVFNRKGVVINDFITELGDLSTGNRNNIITNVSIRNIRSTPVEIIGISCPEPQTGAYGKGAQVGPAGDIIQISEASNDDGTFKENVLVNAKLILGKYNTPKNGTTCVTSEVIQWAESGNQDIRIVAQNADRYFTVGQDSMAHKMKGTIGLFISSGENIKVFNVTIDGVEVKGNKVGTDRKLFRPGDDVDMQGAICYGIVITGSKDINMTNVNVNDVKSTHEAVGVFVKSSTGVSNNNLGINNVKSDNKDGILILQN